MGKVTVGMWGILFLSLLLAIGCAPGATPTPSPTPVPVSTQPAPTSIASALSPEDAAWDKVVEAAKKEGKVNAYAYLWVGDVGLAIADAFKKKYGITVDIITGRGAEFTERLKVERRLGRVVGDMMQGSVVLNNNMRLEGLLTSVADELPSLQEKGVWWALPTSWDPKDKTNLGFLIMEYTPYINTRLVKPGEEPQSFRDLLESKWKGKMSLTEPNISAGPYQFMVVLMENKVWDEDYIRALYKQNLSFPLAVLDEYRMLGAGDIQLMIRGADGGAGTFIKEGAPIKAIGMKEGVVYSTSTLAAIATAPHPNASKVFLNWLFSSEGMAVLGKAQATKMIRKDVPDFRPAAAQVTVARPLVETVENLEKATQLFRDKWFDKLVGR